jgi:hypothetical protein
MAVPNFEDLLELVKQGPTLATRERVLAWRESALKLQEENLLLKQQLKRLESASEVSGKMFYERGLYWLRLSNEDDAEREGPFCQTCYDRERKPVRLQPNPGPEGGWFCTVCRNHF